MSWLRWEIPVDPDAPTARDWLAHELAKPEYQAAQPTWFDRAANEVRKWFLSLFEHAGSAPGGALGTLAVVVIIALIALALWKYGAPRMGQRRTSASPLFAADDTRDLAALRKAAEAAAAAGDWALAIEERFRAIARGLSDRDLVLVHPGSTATAISLEAAQRFRAEQATLRAAADVFDAVRYLGATGSREQYEHVTALEERVSGTPAPAVSA
ncbi:MAG TPA: DUF4129 domain-containing protein [Candidatus Lumbricidophila sp.]|nr:DUF4129 domain-containing protein [Candidatus Lumbricidophila sp.]